MRSSRKHIYLQCNITDDMDNDPDFASTDIKNKSKDEGALNTNIKSLGLSVNNTTQIRFNTSLNFIKSDVNDGDLCLLLMENKIYIKYSRNKSW